VTMWRSSSAERIYRAKCSGRQSATC